MTTDTTVSINLLKDAKIFDAIYEGEPFLLLCERRYRPDGGYDLTVDTAIADNWTLHQFMEEYMGVSGAENGRVESEIIGYYPNGAADRREVMRDALKALKQAGIEVDRYHEP